MLEWLILTVIGTLLLIATREDIKTREVPDYISYLIIGIGIVYRINQFLTTKNFHNLLLNSVMLIGGASFGLIMYKFKQWGGADTKILIGLSLIFGGEGKIPRFVLYFINFIWIGAIYGISSSILLAVMHYNKMKDWIKKDYKKNKTLYLLGLGIILGSALTIKTNIIIFVLAESTGIIILLTQLMKGVNSLMIKKISVEKLTEGDWIKHVVEHEGEIIFNPKKHIAITKEQIRKLKNTKIRNVKIMEGIPFLPAITISYITTVLNPMIFLNLLQKIILL